MIVVMIPGVIVVVMMIAEIMVIVMMSRIVMMIVTKEASGYRREQGESD